MENTNSETNASQPKQWTPEELKKAREDNDVFYKEMIPFLKTQLEYETLLADLEEQRYKKLVHIARRIQLLAPAPEENLDTIEGAPGASGTGRHLKREPQ